MDREAVENPFRTYRRRTGEAMRDILKNHVHTPGEETLMLRIVQECKRIEIAIVKAERECSETGREQS